MALRLQEFFGIHGGHAAGTGGSNGLAIMMVLDITCGKHAREFGLAAVVGDQIAIFIRFELPAKGLGIGIVANGHKYALDHQRGGLAPLSGIAEVQASTEFFATSLTSSTTAGVTKLIFELLLARSSMIFVARNSLRR